MRIKATIVAYAFSVQCFENATIVAYAGLRVKKHIQIGHIIFSPAINNCAWTYKINHVSANYTELYFC